MSRPFLTARWESLLLLNYECPRELLEPLVPEGTELDPWRGIPIVSLVGFMFRDTKVLGVPLPGHRTFEEVNLRFYVLRRTERGEERRGVVFIRELVPRRAIATVARVVYNEPYTAVPMSHAVTIDPDVGASVEYRWRHKGASFSMRGSCRGPAVSSRPGSEAEFITEHYWGYTRQRDGSTLEYEVTHPPWRVWTTVDGDFEGDATGIYGAELSAVLAGRPRSAFIAEGSDVAVYPGRKVFAG